LLPESAPLAAGPNRQRANARRRAAAVNQCPRYDSHLVFGDDRSDVFLRREALHERCVVAVFFGKQRGVNLE
jgi:hypothetical protein